MFGEASIVHINGLALDQRPENRGGLLKQLQKLRRDERQHGDQLLLEALGDAALQRGELFAGRDLKLGLLKGGGFRRPFSGRKVKDDRKTIAGRYIFG